MGGYRRIRWKPVIPKTLLRPERDWGALKFV
jgi:hypothetical protein